MKTFVVLALTLSVFSCVYCDHEKVLVRVFDKRTKTSDDESIVIDLKHSELDDVEKEDDTEIKVELHFGLYKNNEVHCNGYHMPHGQVTRLHLNMMLQETRHGQAVGEPRVAPVIVRVFVSTKQLPNGDEVIFAEQQIIAIDGEHVVQLMVHHVYWEKATRKPVIVPTEFGKTYLSGHEFSHDRHFYGHGYPKHPKYGYGYNPHHRHHHHHHHHHHHRSIKCWYHHLTKRSKIALFAGGSFTLLMLVVALACCVRARKTQTRTLSVAAPMDNNVTVTVDDEKKDAKQFEDDKYKFHFEMDNAVVVDDKKQLIS